MRISDWSSDVCSSYLRTRPPRARAPGRRGCRARPRRPGNASIVLDLEHRAVARIEGELADAAGGGEHLDLVFPDAVVALELDLDDVAGHALGDDLEDLRQRHDLAPLEKFARLDVVALVRQHG